MATQISCSFKNIFPFTFRQEMYGPHKLFSLAQVIFIHPSDCFPSKWFLRTQVIFNVLKPIHVVSVTQEIFVHSNITKIIFFIHSNLHQYFEFTQMIFAYYNPPNQFWSPKFHPSNFDVLKPIQVILSPTHSNGFWPLLTFFFLSHSTKTFMNQKNDFLQNKLTEVTYKWLLSNQRICAHPKTYINEFHPTKLFFTPD